MSKKQPKHTNTKKTSLLYKLGVAKRPFRMTCDYRGDGLGVKGKSFTFMDDSKFQDAWNGMSTEVKSITGKDAPDVRWRGHIALWAASIAMAREGDFVECGVFSGLFSGLICRYFDFATINKKFWLFDTWEGIPTEGLSGRDLTIADGYNKDYHRVDVFAAVQKAFSAYPNCNLVKGLLPGTLDVASIDKIAYLSIDLNNASYEKLCIEKLWPKLTSGAVVLLDDYNFANCYPQKQMWDAFAQEQGIMIAAMPTGQGLIIKP